MIPAGCRSGVRAWLSMTRTSAAVSTIKSMAPMSPMRAMTTTAAATSAPAAVAELPLKAPRRGVLAPVESPLVEAFVNNIMKQGKKTVARRILSDALKLIQIETSKNPTTVLAAAVEKVEPLFKMVGVKRGAKSIQTPTPLTERQRRRTAIIWIIEAAQARNKRDPAGIRIGKEVMAVLNDDSAAIQKRNQIHKSSLVNRSNVTLVDRRVRK
ncbi:hypothetical protein HDU77_002374 [Chytriomyces hyalinus]|nr:hypothetical protein HDU77_002374 [Chytriomyces hyalinus]